MKIFRHSQNVTPERPHVAVSKKTGPNPLEPATPSRKTLGVFGAVSVVNVLRVQILRKKRRNFS